MGIMIFMDFCRSKADGIIPEGMKTEQSVIIPEKYKAPADILIKNMKIKRDIFDKINIPYIENAFEGDYSKILDDKLIAGDVPDGLIYYLADGIYGKSFYSISDEQRMIIKVLSVYICIQN